MSEKDIVDARNLPCPQPVILVRGKIKEMESGTFTVIVNTEVSRDNVIRAASNRGWTAEYIEEKDGEFRILFRKEK